jgi:hypothetical protein
MTKELELELKRLEEDLKKNQKDLEIYKNKISSEIKNLNKDNFFVKKPINQKLTLWQRLKRVLNMN